MSNIAQNLERDTTARFAVYVDDNTIGTEAINYIDKESMQTQLHAAFLSLELTLKEMVLRLAPHKTELISINDSNCTKEKIRILLPIGSLTIPSKMDK